MTSLNCFNCNEAVTNAAIFCSACGTRLKCSNCEAQYTSKSNFCSTCGHALGNASSSTTSLNTIKYRKTNNETSYDIAFSDAIGREGVSELILAVLQSRSTQSNPDIRSLPHGIDVTYLNNVDHSDAPTINNSEPETTEETEAAVPDFPHLNDLDTKVECNEITWIGIHALYLSSFGTKNFTRDAVRSSYLNRRLTDSRSNQFSVTFKKAHKLYFRTINNDEFGFESKKINELKKLILDGENSSSSKSAKIQKPKSHKKTPAKSIAIQEFDLYGSSDKKIPSLENVFKSKIPENTSDRILVIAYYINRILSNISFTEGQIEFAFKALQLPDRPGHLRQIVNNLKTNKVWFKDVVPGQWTLERLGELYVEDKLPLSNS
jgi:hypothetical protein